MKKIFLTIIALSLFCLQGMAQCTGTTLSVTNPSFEGTPGTPHVTPPSWDICQPGVTPDTQPGCWGVTLPPSNGSSYLGLVYSSSQSWYEGAGQQLSSPMIVGVTYNFTIDLATTNSTQGGIQPGCIEIQIWGNMGGNGGCAMTTLLWSSGNVTSLTWQTYTVSITPTQPWTNLLFMSHGLGCSDQPYILLDNMTPIIPVLDNPKFTWTNVCLGSTMQFTDQSTSAQGTINSWNWNFGDGSTSTVQNPTHTYAAAGNYNVTLTVTSTVPCTTTVTNSVTVNALPPVAATPATASICSGSSAPTTASGASTFQWSPATGLSATTGANITASPAASTTYTVTGTDANGCTNTATFVVTVNANPVASINKVDASCGLNNGSATAMPPGFTYSWNGGQNTQTISNLAAGTYSVTISDGNGCSSSATCNITNTANGTVSLTSTDEHCTQSDGTATATVFGGTAPFSYTWNNLQTTQTITGLPAGTYTVATSDVNGCTATGSVNVINVAGPTLQIVSTTNETCTYGNGAATVSAINGTPNYVYNWSNAGSGATVSNLSAGTYTVTVTDANNCTDATSLTITDSPPPTLSTTSTPSDCGQTNGTATVTVNGGLQPYSYNWDTTPPQTNATATNVASGNYTVTVTDANSCTAATVANVGYVNTLAATASATPEYCYRSDGTVTVMASGGSGTYTYLWNNASTSQTDTALTAGNYSVTVSDGFCTTNTSVAVPFVGGPTAGFSARPKILTLMDGPVSFKDNSTGNIVSWIWEFGDGTPLGSGENTTHTYSDLGTYEVSLYVIDVNGCSDTTTDTVKIKDIYSFYIPNAFSPNGNSINDEWAPKFNYIDLRRYECLIFDRWGNLMYSTVNPYVGWNGTQYNEGGPDDVVMGTYVYHIKVRETDGPMHEYIGNITLVP